MRIEGEFTVESMTPATVAPAPEPVATAVPVTVAVMRKRFAGDIDGESSTVFTSAFNHETGVGGYTAMESFAGTIGGRTGALVFFHTATTQGTDRGGEILAIVPGSGTGELAGSLGSGGMSIDADGTHRIWLQLSD